jgi:UDPglucose 6-dehydrogenase
MKEKIVVVGFGWVGQANALALSIQGYPVSYFDPAEPPHHHKNYADAYARLTRLKSAREGDSADTVFVICVGDRVSEDGVQDISLIEKALNDLKGVQGSVILRSTILPDTLASLSFDFYVPEFLHEKTAVEECLNPYLFVVGKKSGKPEPDFFALWERLSYKVFRGTPEEASHIKYLSNLWNSVRIAFVNEFGDAMAVPSDKEKLGSIERVIDFLFDRKNYMRYGKSFGGHCLPKDTRAFARWYKDKGKAVDVIAGSYVSNAKHQEIEKKYPILPEWFSEWPDRHISAKVALKALAHSILKRLKF